MIGAGRSMWREVALAALVPAALIAASLALWWLWERYPLIASSRAWFGWLVVVPLWGLAPVAAAIVARPMTSRSATAGQALVGLALATLVGGVLYAEYAKLVESCMFGPAHDLGGAGLQIALIAVLAGGGWVVAARAATGAGRTGAWWRALFIGVGLLLFHLLLLIVMFAPYNGIGGCNRPH